MHQNSLANLRPNPQWAKGTSGNPGGFTKDFRELAKLARSHGKEAIEILVEKMRHSRDDRVQIMAAKILLDRGYGAAKLIEDGDITRPMPTPEERLAMLHEIARRLGLSLVPISENASDDA